MSETGNKSSKSSAQKPTPPKTPPKSKEDKKSASIKSDSSRKVSSCSEKTASCSNKLKSLTVTSSKSSSSKNKLNKPSSVSENSDKTIDLTGESTRKSKEILELEKLREDAKKKDDFIRALQGRVFNQEPLQTITPGREAIRDKCNTCKLIKPLNQTWKVHNSSADHIRYMVQNQGRFFKTTKKLERNFLKELNLFCELCGTWYPDIVSYCAHKFETEHQNRTRDLSNWRSASKNAGTNIAGWNRVSKPKSVDSKTLSKAIRKSISKGK